ncbi:MAG: 2-hydroxychromene-2-carboxylate isomerase, partial [Pseudomonadales bacterium]|nr:2-hydroxychromene-2-carboxylate isomerase [Pseudomonadales bacterium]
MPKIEFHFDFGSPNAYLSHLVLPQVEAEIGLKFKGLKFEYVPVLLGGVFKATNNVSPMVSMQGIKNKPDYSRIETERFLKTYNIFPYTPNPYFPVNTLKIMRGAVFAQKTDYFKEYVDLIYKSMWHSAYKMDDIDVIESAIKTAGLPLDEIITGMNEPSVKQRLIDNTEQSVSRGTFGSPTFYV